LADGIGGTDNDVLIATGLSDRRDRRLVGLDIGGQHQQDIAVGDRLGDRGLADVLYRRIEILIAQGLNPVGVLIEDEHVVVRLGEILSNCVADTATAEDRVGRP